jgi:hypothetical protein
MHAHARFGELLSGSFQDFKKLRRVLLLGALIFGVLSLLLQIPLQQWSAKDVPYSWDMFRWMFPLYLVAMIVGMVNYAYFLVVAVKHVHGVSKALKAGIGFFLPLLGVTVWILLRSYVWLMALGALVSVLVLNGSLSPTLQPLGSLLLFVGLVLFIVYGPRFLFAPILMLSDKKSIRKIVQHSLVVTRGYWGKIVGNYLLLLLCYCLVLVVVTILTTVLVATLLAVLHALQLSSTAETLLAAAPFIFVQQLTIAFFILFLKRLCATMIAHPRK